MKFTVYQSKKDRQWYWNLKARNGRIVACSGEGYTAARKAISSFWSIANSLRVGSLRMRGRKWTVNYADLNRAEFIKEALRLGVE